jgi:nitroreductase
VSEVPEFERSEAISLLEGLSTTRAIRRYRPDPISDGDLAAIFFATTRAPSGSNRQPARFVVLRDSPAARLAKELLGRSFRAQWAAKRAVDGYSAGSGADPSSPKARMAATMAHFVDHFEATPVVVLACLDRGRSPQLHDGASVYPACQNLLLAARALGYGGVLTVWHSAVEDELRALVGIPDDVFIAATIPLGRPVGGHGPVRRRPLADVVFEDRWAASATWAVDPPGARHTTWRRASTRPGRADSGR